MEISRLCHCHGKDSFRPSYLLVYILRHRCRVAQLSVWSCQLRPSLSQIAAYSRRLLQSAVLLLPPSSDADLLPTISTPSAPVLPLPPYSTWARLLAPQLEKTPSNDKPKSSMANQQHKRFDEPAQSQVQRECYRLEIQTFLIRIEPVQQRMDSSKLLRNDRGILTRSILG